MDAEGVSTGQFDWGEMRRVQEACQNGIGGDEYHSKQSEGFSMSEPTADTEATEQVTKDQHFVPKFYLRWFAKDAVIQVLDLKGKRIGKPRPFASVCYEKFFYAAQTGVRDDVSQAFEQAFGTLETQIADRLPDIIDRAHAKALSDDAFDILAHAMSLQWMRTLYFRQRIQRMQADAMKQVMRIVSSFPQFAATAKRAAAQEGLTGC